MKNQTTLGVLLGSLLAFAFAVGVSSSASAQDGVAAPARVDNGFGAPGQIAISGEMEGHLHNGWELRLHPALDYFIAPNVSVGGALGITYDHPGSPSPSVTTVEVAARVGYNLNIVDRISFWPRVGIAYSHTSVASSPSTSSSSTALTLFAPFLYHLVPHLFVGAGPSFGLSLNGGGNSYGLDTIVGGWF